MAAATVWSRTVLRCMTSHHVSPVRENTESDRSAGASGAAGRPRRVLLALRAPGQRPVRGAVLGRFHRRDHRFVDPGLYGPRGHPDHVEPAGETLDRAVADPDRYGGRAAAGAAVRHDDPRPGEQPG